MVQRRRLFTDLLRASDHMKAFVSHRIDGEEELRQRLERSKANLAVAQRNALEKTEALRRVEEDKEAFQIKLAEAKSREEHMNILLNEAEREKTQLGGEVRQLWTEASIERKQKEDLQLRLVAQKKELEVRFAV